MDAVTLPRSCAIGGGPPYCELTLPDLNNLDAARALVTRDPDLIALRAVPDVLAALTLLQGCDPQELYLPQYDGVVVHRLGVNLVRIRNGAPWATECSRRYVCVDATAAVKMHS